MAVRVELHKDYTKRALEAALASLRRSEKAAHNPAMKALIEEDIKLYRHAIDTITDTK